jgi:type IV pilus assembly protein PilC
MPKFTYEAMNQAGDTIKDEIEAATNEDALSKIRNLGYFPTKIREKGAKGSKKKKAGGKKKPMAISLGGVKTKVITQFTRQLSTLQDAGLPILRSLRILEEQQKPGLLKNVTGDVADDVEGGSTLSEAMAKHPKAFNRLYVNMVAAGESGGVLDVILQRLAEFMEKAEKLKRRIKGAMIYPACVMSFAALIVGGIMVVVVPSFQEIFEDFDTDMPAPTLMLMAISNWFIGKGPAADGSEDHVPGVIILALSPFFAFLLVKLLRQSKMGTLFLDKMFLKIPVLGQVLGKGTIARFTRTLGTLINAGVPILEAITITRDTCGNEVFARALNTVHDAIREGESFAEPLRATKVVDSIVTNMIDVGEETGEMDKMLMKIADNYDEEVEVLVESLVSLLEPIMIMVLGGIVGFIVVSLFLPLVSLIDSVSGGT